MSVLLYEAENLHGCDRLKPGLLLPRFSHTHTAAVKVFLQTHLPKEYFPWGIDCHRHPSFLCWESHFLPPLSFSSKSGRKAFVLSDCCFSKPDLCPRVFCGGKKLAEELPQSKSVTGYGILIE